MKTQWIAALLLLVFKPCFGGIPSPFAPEQAPEIQPFELPTLDGSAADFNGYIDPLTKAPKMDADSIFMAAVNCYPEPSLFKAELALEGGVGSFNSSENNSTLGKTYVGIVARLPLYSAKEHNREREREFMRRQKLSDAVSSFIKSIATRNHAIRESALYRALESRSQVRVQKGLVSVAEQVGYMEKLLAAHKVYVEAQANVTSARLVLTAGCADYKRPRFNNWLKRLSQEPGAKPNATVRENAERLGIKLQ